MAQMDAFAPLPKGEDLTLDIATAAKPLAPLATSAAARSAQLNQLQPTQPKHKRKPKEKPPIGEDVPRDRLLNRPDAPDARAEVIEARILPPQPAKPATAKPGAKKPGAKKTASGLTAAPTVATFIGGTDTQTVSPPDTAGGVGRKFVLTALNDMVYVHDRTGKVLSAVSLDAFWRRVVKDPSLDTFDPRIVYDQKSDRFYFAAMANAESPKSCLLLAVSTTNNPGGAWRGVQTAVDPAQSVSGAVWLDFPSIGFSDDKITVTVNLFKIAGNTFAGASIYVFEKSNLLVPTGPVTVKRFDLFNKGSTFVPAVTRDPGTADHWLANRWSGSQLALYRITGSVAAGSAALVPAGFVMSPGSAWNSFGQLPGGKFLQAPQTAVKNTVDPGDDRLLAMVLRHKTLFVSHGIFLPAVSPDRTAAQIWRIDTTGFATTTLRIDRPSGGAGKPIFVSYPTVDVNRAGDLLIGHAWLSAALRPSGALTFLAGGNPTAATTMVFAPGLDSYQSSDRWGDYSVTQVDPQDDATFWTQQERAAKRVKKVTIWQTVWAVLVAPLSPAPPAATA